MDSAGELRAGSLQRLGEVPADERREPERPRVPAVPDEQAGRAQVGAQPAHARRAGQLRRDRRVEERVEEVVVDPTGQCQRAHRRQPVPGDAGEDPTAQIVPGGPEPVGVSVRSRVVESAAQHPEVPAALGVERVAEPLGQAVAPAPGEGTELGRCGREIPSGDHRRMRLPQGGGRLRGGTAHEESQTGEARRRRQESRIRQFLRVVDDDGPFWPRDVRSPGRETAGQIGTGGLGGIDPRDQDPLFAAPARPVGGEGRLPASGGAVDERDGGALVEPAQELIAGHGVGWGRGRVLAVGCQGD
ncbi:hypothetical protein ACFQWG_05705 [Schaalia naturae]|uniref:Uncharacterized protein n=1 Tax=Schaalia naturae TaxID=635203 RepID=A0ABW2SLJ3_9ACTO